MSDLEARVTDLERQMAEAQLQMDEILQLLRARLGEGTK